MNDLKFAFRQLLKNPGFTAVVVLTLALGIGANTAIFSVVKVVLWRPLGLENAGQLVEVLTFNRQYWNLEHDQSQFTRFVDSPADFFDWKDQNRVFVDMLAIRGATVTMKGDEEPEQVEGARVSGNFFSFLSVQPSLGRGFLSEDDKADSQPVVILSHGFWQRRFGGDPSIIGKTLKLDKDTCMVVGVMPRRLPLFGDFDLWFPNPFKGVTITAHGWGPIGVIARLKPGVTLPKAQTEMSAIASRLEQAFPDSNKNCDVQITPLGEILVRNARAQLLLLFCAVGVVLLIACVNVANLLMARAAARQKEIAIRAAVGASRRRLIRQLLLESLLLGVLGGVLGIFVALWGVDLLSAITPNNIYGTVYRPTIPFNEIGLDRHMLEFSLGVSLVTGLLFGLVPAVQGSKPNLNETLKESGSKTGAGFAGQRFTEVLVVAQVALALMLLISAGLLLESFLRVASADLGFNPEKLLSLQINLSPDRYTEAVSRTNGVVQQAKILPKREIFLRQVLEQIKSLPGVEAVGARRSRTAGSHHISVTNAEGRFVPAPLAQDRINNWAVTPNYFQTMGMRLLKGRYFTESDTTVGAQGVAIINESLSRRLFADQDPIGKSYLDGNRFLDTQPREIVGLVADNDPWYSLLYGTYHRPAADRLPQIFLPFQRPERNWSPAELGFFLGIDIVVRTTARPMSLAAAARKIVSRVDPDQPIASVKTMKQWMDVYGQNAKLRFYLCLLAVFAGVALTLTMIGVYGVISYSVRQRTREIGVRMALGAKRVDVMRLVLRQGMVLAVIGLTIGLPSAFAATRVLSSLLYEIQPTDPLTFASVTLLILVVALLACWLPARSAAKVDPMEALRCE